MKKPIIKFGFCLLLVLSIFSFVYINKVEISSSPTKLEYQEIAQSTDKIVGSVKSATLVIGKIVDFLTRGEA
jgi:hypothetical protein